MESILSFFTAFGLSSSAGLNAYIPLLITGLVARYTDLITLSRPFDTLENPYVLITLGVLLIIEMGVDKVPALDTLNDVIHTVVRPAAGAVLFAAQAGVIGQMDVTLAAVLGLLAAGTIHATKASVRPMVTATTGGMGNWVVSAVEDVVSLTASLLAIFVPMIMGILLIITLFFVIRWWWGRRQRAQVPL
jgi:hypothetical protein